MTHPPFAGGSKNRGVLGPQSDSANRKPRFFGVGRAALAICAWLAPGPGSPGFDPGLGRRGLTLAALALLASLASSCISIVEVRTADKPPALSLYPFGVKVDRNESDAVEVDAVTLGLGGGCGAYAAGMSRFSCTHADPAACGVAIVTPNAATDEDFLGRISDQSRAHCLHHKEKKQ